MKRERTDYGRGSGMGPVTTKVARRREAARLALAAAAVLAVLAGCGTREQDPAPPAEAAVRDAPEYAVLNGRWQRPDGGYVLEIRSVDDGGGMVAAYFNPNPIHVARAQAVSQDGRLEIEVELRDVNYPGSTYRLRYDPSNDRLAGTYYQAVAQETYPVMFARRGP